MKFTKVRIFDLQNEGKKLDKIYKKKYKNYTKNYTKIQRLLNKKYKI